LRGVLVLLLEKERSQNQNQIGVVQGAIEEDESIVATEKVAILREEEDQTRG